MPARVSDHRADEALATRARAGLPAKVLYAGLAGAAVGALVLAFGGQAAAAVSILWAEHVLPAFLDLHMSGLPFC